MAPICPDIVGAMRCRAGDGAGVDGGALGVPRKCRAVMEFATPFEDLGVLVGDDDGPRPGVANSSRVGRMLVRVGRALPRAVFCRDAVAFSLSAKGQCGGGGMLTARERRPPRGRDDGRNHRQAAPVKRLAASNAEIKLLDGVSVAGER